MAFRATLEEVLNADIILHVRDIANPDTAVQCEDVLKVLDNLGLKEIKYATNYIEVLNKADLLTKDELTHWQNKTAGLQDTVLVSAVNGIGCNELLILIEDKLTSEFIECKVTLSGSDGKTAAWLYENGRVTEVESGENADTYTIMLSADNLSRLDNMARNNNLITIRK